MSIAELTYADSLEPLDVAAHADESDAKAAHILISEFSLDELHDDLRTLVGLIDALTIIGQSIEGKAGLAVTTVAEQAALVAQNSYDIVVCAKAEAAS